MHWEHNRYNEDVEKRRLGLLAANEPKCDETELKRRLSVLQSILTTDQSTDRNKFLAMVDIFDTWQWAYFGSDCPSSEQISAMMQLQQPSHIFDGFNSQLQMQQQMPAEKPAASPGLQVAAQRTSTEAEQPGGSSFSSTGNEAKKSQLVNTGPPFVSCESIT